MSVTQSELSAAGGYRARAKKHFIGFENILMPSFSPDLGELDEEGIRHDVRQSIRNEFFSVFCVGLSLSPEETRRFFEIVVDEANGRIAVGAPLMAPTREMSHALLAIAEEAGLTHILLHPFPTFQAADEEELFGFYSDIVEKTKLAVVLWASDGLQFQNLHPSNVALDVYDRVANYENVVALKLMTTLDLTVVYECCERLHDRLLIGGVHLGIMPHLVSHYGMQWSGAWTVEALQSPDKPYVNQYLEHLRKGRFDEAKKTYWQMKPAYDALFALMAPMLSKGVHPFTHLKYYQWCSGGNGGLLRMPEDPNEINFPLRPEERSAIRDGFKSIGISPRENDDSFMLGAVNYEKGINVNYVKKNDMYVP